MGRKGILSVVLIFAFAITSSIVSASPLEAEEDYSPDEIIVKLKNSNLTDEALLNKLTSKLSAKSLSGSAIQRLHKPRRHHRRKLSEFRVVKLNKELSKKELKALIANLNLSQDADIEAMYPNYIYRGSEDTTGIASVTAVQALTHASQDYDWASEGGAEVVVAVIDSGVNYKHPDLAKNIWSNEDEIPSNGKDDDRNGYIDDIRGYDFVAKASRLICAANEDCSEEDADPSDVNGHGTHVAGIIAASKSNPIGINGVAPLAKIMPLRAAYSDGQGTYLKTSDIYDAIVYAIDNKADVINMSFVGIELNVLEDILSIANDMGIVLVAAAGNRNVPYQQYPAAIPFVIAVGAVDANNQKAYYSNYGSWVDIAAPGSNILSTGIKGYESRSGTSMAAPFVAGVAALIKSKDRSHSLSAADIRQRILEAAIPNEDFAAILSLNIQSPTEINNIELDSVLAYGEEASFKAEASKATAYMWTSNLDGELASSQSFTKQDLSVGTHLISVRARGDDGEWSKPVTRVLRVLDSDHVVDLASTNIALDIGRINDTLVARSSSSKKIARYLWESNIDGSLGESKALMLSSLSPGFHRISLSIQDRDGNISSSVEQSIQVQ